MGTGIQSQYSLSPSIQSAASVLQQGSFDSQQLVAGQGGNITVSGRNTVILDGTLSA